MKVTIITDRFPPQSATSGLLAYSSAIELSQLGHEVQIVTHQPTNENISPPNLPDRVQLLQSFRNWGFLETSRLIPFLIQYRPDAIHLFPSGRDKSKKLFSLFNIISSARPVLGPIKLFTSISHLDNFAEGLLVNLARGSDLITFTAEDRQQGQSFVRRYNSNLDIKTLDPSLSFLTMIEDSEMRLETNSRVLWIPNQLEEYIRSPQKLKKFEPVLSAESDLLILMSGAELNQLNGSLRSLQNFLNKWNFGPRTLISHSWNPISVKTLQSSLTYVSIDALATNSPLLKIIGQFCLLSEVPQLVFENKKWTTKDFDNERLNFSQSENSLSRIYSQNI